MKLAPILDLSAAAPLWAQLCEARGRPLTLDASSVERVGGQCLQVLLAARAQWQADAVEFAVSDPSPLFLDCLRLMGAERLASVEEA